MKHYFLELTVMFVLLIISLIGRLTFFLTLWSLPTLSTRRSGTIHMVFTGGNHVWYTSLFTQVEVSIIKTNIRKSAVQINSK